MDVVRLSALHTSRLYSPGNIPGTLDVKSTQEGKDYANENFQCQHWELNPRPSGL